jgi:hypothetical protein
MPITEPLIPTYDTPLVLLSVLVAVLASYSALDLTGRVAAAHGRTRLAWLSGGSVALGVGIWSMHFIGMLAFRLPVPVTYDPLLVVLSVVIAISASFAVLWQASLPRLAASRLVGCAVRRLAGHRHHGLGCGTLAGRPVPERRVGRRPPAPGRRRGRDGARNRGHALHRHGGRDPDPRARGHATTGGVDRHAGAGRRGDPGCPPRRRARDRRRHGGSPHPRPAGRSRGGDAAPGEGRRPDRQPSQERVPGEHEPRDPDADERDHRLHPAAPRCHGAHGHAARVARHSRTPPGD